LGRDAPLAIVLTLQFMLESGKTIHDLFLSLPQYKIVKSKITTAGLQADKILEKIAADHADQPINFLDGLKIDTATTWVHLRKSNTEPIIRIMAEANPKQKLSNWFKNTARLKQLNN
jgi:phosphomannomutase